MNVESYFNTDEPDATLHSWLSKLGCRIVGCSASEAASWLLQGVTGNQSLCACMRMLARLEHEGSSLAMKDLSAKYTHCHTYGFVWQCYNPMVISPSFRIAQ